MAKMLKDSTVEVRLAAHAIGLDNKKPYIRHGKSFYKPYRNYYHIKPRCKDCKIWLTLVSKKYADWWGSIVNGEFIYHFFLTDKGLSWLGNQLNVKIHKESD